MWGLSLCCFGCMNVCVCWCWLRTNWQAASSRATVCSLCTHTFMYTSSSLSFQDSILWLLSFFFKLLSHLCLCDWVGDRERSKMSKPACLLSTMDRGLSTLCVHVSNPRGPRTCSCCWMFLAALTSSQPASFTKQTTHNYPISTSASLPASLWSKRLGLRGYPVARRHIRCGLGWCFTRLAKVEVVKFRVHSAQSILSRGLNPG